MTHLVGRISSSTRDVPLLDGETFTVARAQGPYLWSVEGRRYIDAALGFGAVLLGHAPEPVLEAVRAAMMRGPLPAFPHALEEEAAAALAARTGALSKVVFLNSGSEAVHLACRLARIVTGRGTIAKMAAGYDGWFDGVSLGTMLAPEAAMTANQRPARGGFTLTRFNDIADAEQMFADSDDIAAVIVEPALANAGCIVPRPGYLEALAALARRHGALVISDEVLMGFRLHAGLAADVMGLKPDLAVCGKAIGGGFAVSALIGVPEVMRAFEDGRIGRAGTYNGNAVATAAVKASMTELAKLDYRAFAARGERLRAAIVLSFAEAGLEVSTSGYGPVFTVWRGAEAPQSYAEALARHSETFTLALHKALRREGVMSMASMMGRHYISAAHDDAVIDAMQLAFAGAAKRLARGE